MRLKKTEGRLINNVGLVFGGLSFLAILMTNPFSLFFKENFILAVTVLMFCWWIFETVPLPITALLPLILFPTLNILSIKDVANSYADPSIFLFMGGFFLAIAIEKWNLHKRIALNIIKFTGFNGNKIILGFILATGFLSLWLSNSATTMMMFPIALSVIKIMERNNINKKSFNNFSLSLMLSIAYASNVAIGTIIGTPPNVAYANYIYESFNYEIGFTTWLILFFPLTIVLLLLVYFVLIKILFPNNIQNVQEGKLFIKEQLNKLGKLSGEEIKVAFVFVATALGWILKDYINDIQSLVKLNDAAIAISGALLLFIIPEGKKEKNRTSLLSWNDAGKLPWDILILFGGGLALAKGIEEVKLFHRLDSFFILFKDTHRFLIVLIIAGISVFASEFISNIAQVMIMAPLVSAFAISLHTDPLMLGIPMTLAASCASMLPMGTPPNAIVFSSGYVKMGEMLKAGLILNIICALIIGIYCYFIQPFFMKIV